MAQYIGEKEVVSIEDTIVTCKDWEEEETIELTPRQLQYMITDEPKDATAVREMIIVEFARDMLQIIEQHDVRKWDIDAILNVLVQSYNGFFNTAIGKAMWTYDETKHHSLYIDELRVSDLKKFVKG